MSKLNENHLKIMLTQLVKVLSDYGAIKTEVSNIQSSAQKILDVSEKTRGPCRSLCKISGKLLRKGSDIRGRVMELYKSRWCKKSA